MHSPDAEAIVLSSMVVHRWSVGDIIDRVEAADFWDPTHRVLFDAVVDEWTHSEPGAPVDWQRIWDFVAPAELDVTRDEVETLLRSRALGGRKSVERYCTIVLEWAHVRRLHQHRDRVSAILAEIQDPANPTVGPAGVDDAQAEIQDAALSLSQGRDGVSVAAWVDDAAAGIKDELAGVRVPITTGHPDLDRMLRGGWRAGELIIVGGRTSAGKTGFAVGAAVEAAKKGAATLFVSLEMGGSEMLARLAQREDRPVDTAERVDAFAAEVREWDLRMLCRPALTVAQIRTEATRQNLASSLDVVVVDYVQRVRPDDPRAQRYVQLGDIAEGLKTLAQELDVAVIAPAQVSREVARRGTDAKATRPRLDDLRESAALEHEADKVLFVHRPAMYSDEYREHQAEIVVAKHRQGATGIVSANWIGHRSTFLPATRDAGLTSPNGEISYTHG